MAVLHLHSVKYTYYLIHFSDEKLGFREIKSGLFKAHTSEVLEPGFQPSSHSTSILLLLQFQTLGSGSVTHRKLKLWLVLEEFYIFGVDVNLSTPKGKCHSFLNI